MHADWQMPAYAGGVDNFHSGSQSNDGSPLLSVMWYHIHYFYKLFKATIMVKLRRIDANETLHDPTEDLEAKSLLGAEVMRQFRAALFSKKSQRVFATKGTILSAS